MNKRLFSFFLVFVIAFIAFIQISYSNKNFAPTGRTNAPGEMNCTNSCHNSYALQTTMPERITITANGVELTDTFTYAYGESYSMNLSISGAHARNGFSLTLLNASNALAGSLSTTDANARFDALGNGKEYIGHNANAGISSWSFTWTAPADSQVVTLYSIVNISNDNNSFSGDSILTKQITFTAEASTPSAIKDFALTDKVSILNPAQNQTLTFSIDVKEAAHYSVQLFDLKGSKVLDKSYFLHNGYSQISEPVEVGEGIYFLKIKTGNKFSSYKVVF